MVAGLYYKTPIYAVHWDWREYREVLKRLVLPHLSCESGRTTVESYIKETYHAAPILLNSGRSGLELALLRIERLTSPRKRKSVAVPSFICRSVPEKIVKAGMTPVFYDIDRTISPNQENCIGSIRTDTVAVVFPYIYGRVVDISKLARYCKDRGLFLIEDCASSFLLSDDTGTLSGTRGDYVIISFAQGKTIVAGSGGVLLDRTGLGLDFGDLPPSWSRKAQRNLAYSKTFFILNNIMKAPAYWFQRIAGPFRPSFSQQTSGEIRSIAPVDLPLIMLQVRKWDYLYSRKIAVLSRYAKNLSGSLLTLPQYKENGYVSRLFVRFPFPIIKRTDECTWDSAVVDFLRKRGIQTQLPYYPIHRTAYFSSYPAGSLANTNEFCDSVVEVPTQHRLKDDEIDYVSECLLECAKTLKS